MPVNPHAPGQSPTGGHTGEWCAPSVESLTELVHSFYAQVRADALLGPVFENALRDRWEPHLARMVDFWCTVALGSKRFRGNVFAKHMALQGVTPAHFAAWVRLWAEQTERLFAPEVARDLQITAHGIARNLFLGYFGTPPGFDESARDPEPAIDQSTPDLIATGD